MNTVETVPLSNLMFKVNYCNMLTALKNANIKSLIVIAGPPYWISKPTNISAKINENIEIKCDAGGSPNPAITWINVNGRINTLIDLI